MRGWQIFRYSFWMVMNNLEAAFRLSVVLYALQALNQVLVLLYAPSDPMKSAPVPMGTAMIFLVTGILAVFASLWIAVAWHRYVLTGESEPGAVPPLHGGIVLGYLGRSMMLGLIVVLGLIVAAIPVGIAAALAPPLFIVLIPGLLALGAYLFLRLAVILPAAAIGQKLSLKQAWDATGQERESIIVLALIVVGLSLLVQLPTWMNADPRSLINLVYVVVTGWFATMIGVSVLTTLFTVYVEGRSID